MKHIYCQAKEIWKSCIGMLFFSSCGQLAEELQNKPLEEDERELLLLLSTPHIKVHIHHTHVHYESFILYNCFRLSVDLLHVGVFLC